MTSPESTKVKGWWRRNIWGLLLLVPAMALILVVQYPDLKERLWAHEPRLPVNVSSGQTADYAKAKFRLAQAHEVSSVRGFGSSTFPAPAGMQVWEVKLEFQVTGKDDLLGCKVFLEDSAGRQFDKSPDELSKAYLPLATCSYDEDDSEGSAGRYQNTFYFVMPDGATASAVRVELYDGLPRFLRLRIG